MFFFVPISVLAVAGYVAALYWVSAPWWIYVVFLIESALIGGLNEYIHQAYHVSNHWLDRYSWFRSVRAKHWAHHLNLKRNYGIFWFGWDRIFRTMKP